MRNRRGMIFARKMLKIPYRFRRFAYLVIKFRMMADFLKRKFFNEINKLSLRPSAKWPG